MIKSKLLLLLFCPIFVFACQTKEKNKQQLDSSQEVKQKEIQKKQFPTDQIIVTATDREIFDQKMTDFQHVRAESIGELVTEIAHSFLGTPYVEKTLEKDPTEKLVINFHQFDCTTFVETCIALARTALEKDHSLDNYAFNLEQIRYRDGIRNGYVSRLHYFSEWITNNQEKKIIENISQEIKGEQFPLEISFMSKNAQLYPLLKGQDSLIQIIARKEKQISEREFYYIPEDKLRMVEPFLFDGDIVAITTKIKGLDIAHTGFVFRKDDRVHLLHASSANNKVVVSGVPLVNYLKKNKSTTGVIIARLKDREQKHN